MGRESLGEVQDGSRDPWRVLGPVGEVQDGSGDPRGGLGRVEGPLRRSRTGRGTLGRSRPSRGTLGELQNGS